LTGGIRPPFWYTTVQPVREDVQRARQIIFEEGLTGLFRALKQGVALPAVALAPVAAVLQEQQGARM
jgi:hypothetical protein